MITSTKNAHIVQARKLTQRKHRLRQNRFLVEGLQLLGMALHGKSSPAFHTKIVPHEVFYSEALFTGEIASRLLIRLRESGAEVLSVTPAVLEVLSQRDTSQGIVATFALRELEWQLDELEMLVDGQSPDSTAPKLLLILDQLQDPGNLGTLIRTADAVGVKAVILLEPCVDPFDPKTVRSTMGSIFTVPFIRSQNINDVLSQLTELGYPLVGADAKQGQSVWHDDALTGHVALVLGNEARGLNAELRRQLGN